MVVTEWSHDSGNRENSFQGSNDIQEQLQKPCPTTESYMLRKDDNTMRLDIRLGRWDSRRLFRTFDSVLVGTNYPQVSRKSMSCLATQSSLEKLHSLVQVAHHWTGPISVALYVAGEEEFDALQHYLVYLRRCYAPIRERVNFSLAVPKNRAPERQPRAMELPENLDCAKPEATLTEIVGRISSEQTSWRARNVYPQNHMRNLARKNCQTEWIFLTDVDIVPCVNMTTRLDEFLSLPPNNCDKCAYVVPTYELDIRVRFPPNKTELVRLAKKGLARPFHQKVFIHNQFATNFTKLVHHTFLYFVRYDRRQLKFASDRKNRNTNPFNLWIERIAEKTRFFLFRCKLLFCTIVSKPNKFWRTLEINLYQLTLFFHKRILK